MRQPTSRFAPVFLWLQAVIVAAWWIGLWIAPALRRWFVVGDWPVTTLFAFALPDVLLMVIGSAAAASGLTRGRSWARPLLCFVAGAVVYATLWCIGANLATGAGALSTALMLASATGTVWCLLITTP